MIVKSSYLLLICFVLIASTGCRNSSNNDQEPSAVRPLSADDLVTEVKTFPVESGGWGYDISVNQEPYIHQPNIPAINGNIPFKTEEDALKVAALVEQKIKGNIMPPGITVEELQLLGIEIPQ